LFDGAELPTVEDKKFYHIRSAPGMENELWIGVGGKELYRSSDGGKTLTIVKGISDLQSFCFGMPMADSQYPTAFVYATIDGVRAIYRSTDMGESWVKINPDSFILRSAVFLEGDRQTEGVVYFIHSGMGMFWLAPAGTDMSRSKPEEEVVSLNARVMVEDSLMPEDSFEIVENQMYVSLRKLFNMLNADVEWHSEDRSITIKRREYKVLVNSVYADGFELDNGILIDNSGKVYLNGKEVTLKNKMFVKNDTTFISMNDAAELWDISVKYNEEKMIYNLRDTSFTFYDGQWR